MKYGAASFSFLLVDGFDLTASTSDPVEVETESITEETTSLGVGSKTNTPVNIEQGMLTVGQGFFDATTDALHSAIGQVIDVSRIVCAAVFGNIVGKPFFGFSGAYSQKYKVMDKKDGLTMAMVTYLVSGLSEVGVIIQNLATFTANWDTKTGGAGVTDSPVDYTLDPANGPMDIASNTVANPTVITMKSQHGSPIVHGLVTGQKILVSGSNSTPSLNGIQQVTVTGPTTFTVPVNVTIAGTAGSFVLASTPNGGSAFMQITAYSGFTGFVDKIMHSPDDSTYAALVTFADPGSTHTPAKQYQTVAPGNIDRYLANDGVVTGAGSVTVFTGFCRY